METMRRIPQEEMKNCTSVGPDDCFPDTENRFNHSLLLPPWKMRLPMGGGGDHRQKQAAGDPRSRMIALRDP